ncbi:unnamed protein product [Dimorphilus gyrociliatus]|uniref:Receptor ligand binding region domain-containing protein n=1 Tax=Dimorphilus gyrociliatus TaxID=2664684 RepID=A0A7I8W2K1_9ANNE|nr:unnamed protein product [Dimorphilus gyrociliatus]
MKKTVSLAIFLLKLHFCQAIKLQGVLQERPDIWTSFPHKPNTLLLGYITGSKNAPNKPKMYYKPGSAMSGAITIAVEEINRQFKLLPNHSLDFCIGETYGIERMSIRHTANFSMNGIDAIIGPQETCEHEGRIAEAFNVPMISYVSTKEVLQIIINY